MKLDQEIQIVRRCKSGDAAGFRQLYDALAPELFTICRHYISDRQTVDDVFQDGFARIINGIGSFKVRGEGSLGAWARKVMLNNVLLYLRKRRKEKLTFVELTIDKESENEEEDVGAVPQDVLLKMIAELPEGCRTVLNLYVEERMKHTDIAEMLGISTKTVSSQLVRARILLNKKIKQYCQNEDNQR